MPGERIELSTQGFSVLCSTNELPRLILILWARVPARLWRGLLTPHQNSVDDARLAPHYASKCGVKTIDLSVHFLVGVSGLEPETPCL